ncbi:hypothetical protein J6590_032185 [Homalodisca vitripennis]|nr:hypothetical protein J6590_032185 [Homalodisca vitripennis]
MTQPRSPRPSPVCEPEPPCPEPESDWNFMDQDLPSCPFDLLEPQARLYDTSMQVCAEPGSPIPMGISEQVS